LAAGCEEALRSGAAAWAADPGCLVPHPLLILGYSRFNFVRASSILNCQSTLRCLALVLSAQSPIPTPVFSVVGALGAFDNVPFETGGSGQEFLPFFALDAECIQRCQRMFHKDLPVTFADAESFV